MTVQAQILQLIARLQRELGMAVVLITHDLGVVAEVTDRIVVMYAGRIVEAAATDKIFRAPEHPYTWGLLQSIPRLDRPRDEPLIPIAGLPPSLITLPSGCSFHPRCPYVRERHRRVEPELEPLPDDPAHRVACLLDEPDAQADLGGAARPGKDPQQARAAVEARGGAGMSEALVEVRDLVKHFPLTRGIMFQKTGRRRARGRRRLLRRAARRDARHRRRDRVRQDDHGAPDDAAARADERHDPLRRRRRHAPAQACS